MQTISEREDQIKTMEKFFDWKKLYKFFDLKKKKSVILAFDHAVEHGPHKYKGIDLDPVRIAKIAREGGANGVIMHIGAFKLVKEKLRKRVPTIVKLTARTSLTKTMMQELVTSVEEAADVGADGVAVTVYVGATLEHKMLRNFQQIKEAAHDLGLPVFAFMYPRVNDVKSTKVEHVAYAARLGAEIGADVVKTYYTGSTNSFKFVVESTFVPVLCAGGIVTKTEEGFLRKVRSVMEAGANGLAVGRNVWEREDAVDFLKKIKKIVMGNHEKV